MDKYLFIAEKPTEMEAVKETYEKYHNVFVERHKFELDFVCLSGHIYTVCEPKDYSEWKGLSWKELYENRGSLVPEKWRIKPIDTGSAKQARERLDDIFSRNKYDGLVNGCDPDVEGTGIFELCRIYRKWEEYPTYRFRSSSLAELDILKALLELTSYNAPENLNEVKAFHFRQRWDWLIGMNYTIAYSSQLGETIKVGSVKGPTMMLIYQNYAEIRDYKKITDYVIDIAYDNGIKAVYLEENEDEEIGATKYKEARYESEALAALDLSLLRSKAEVVSYKVYETYANPPKLFSLTDLQAEAGRLYRLSPKETLDIAQSLYELRILSYPRTDGNYVTSATADTFLARIEALEGNPELSPFIKMINDEAIRSAKYDTSITDDVKAAKQNHEALIPTGVTINWTRLTENQRRVMSLVAKRFLAHFLGTKEEERMVMVADCNGIKLRSSGKCVTKVGFTVLYDAAPSDSPLPTYEIGDTLTLGKAEVCKRESTAPAKLTTSVLVQKMKSVGKTVKDPELKKAMNESQGIGTEATRAGILEELIKSGYIVVNQKQQIQITQLGIYYVESLMYDEVTSLDWVAYWSNIIQRIRFGENDYDSSYDELVRNLRKGIEKIRTIPQTKRQRIETEAAPIGKCPHCQANVIQGPFGPYCEGKCGMVIGYALGKKLTGNEIQSLLSGENTTITNVVKKDGGTYTARVRLQGVKQSTKDPEHWYYDMAFVSTENHR